MTSNSPVPDRKRPAASPCLTRVAALTRRPACAATGLQQTEADRRPNQRMPDMPPVSADAIAQRSDCFQPANSSRAAGKRIHFQTGVLQHVHKQIGQRIVVFAVKRQMPAVLKTTTRQQHRHVAVVVI